MRKILGFLPITAEYTVLREAETEPTHQEGLRETLIAALTNRGESREKLATLPLQDLTSLAVERIGFESSTS